MHVISVKCQILWKGPFYWMYPFQLKMHIWNGFNVLNIAEYPIEDINVNIAILSLGWKVVECTLPKHKNRHIHTHTQNLHLDQNFEIVLLHVLSNDECKFTLNLFPIMWWPPSDSTSELSHHCYTITVVGMTSKRVINTMSTSMNTMAAEMATSKTLNNT